LCAFDFDDTALIRCGNGFGEAVDGQDLGIVPERTIEL
jgi:hypothetical protein